MKRSGKATLLGLGGVAVLGAVFFVMQGERQKTPANEAPQAVASAAAAPAPVVEPATTDNAVLQKVVGYVRERFGVPDNVTLTAAALKPSIHPDFLQTTIISDSGKQKNNNNAYVSKDQRLLVIGDLYEVKGDPKSEVVERLRTKFKIPETTSVTATDFQPSPYPDLLATTVTVTESPQQKQVQQFFMTKDRQCLVLGSLFNLSVDPREHALRTITTVNHPSVGPSSAPVTIVEFSDLQCPSCARMHEFLKDDVLKKYTGKVRIVFKEFPIPSIHDWTLTATVASQCVYQIDPPAFVPFRTLVFKNQQNINVTNVRDLMLSYGEQVGVDRLRLAACIDSKASLPRVEADFSEGQSVGVRSTPTTFINGKMVVGIPSLDSYYKTIDEALQAKK